VDCNTLIVVWTAVILVLLRLITTMVAVTCVVVLLVRLL
jgi:hypothetical protein